MSRMTKDLNFKNYLILVNLHLNSNSNKWLVMAVSDSKDRGDSTSSIFKC